MKKVLSICLVILTVLSVFSVTASAEAVVPSEYYNIRVDDIYYVVDSTGAYVVGYELNDITPQSGIVVPQTIEYRGQDYDVVGIDDLAFTQATFTSIILPSTIKHIGDGAFSSCDYLENVVIPNDCEFESIGFSVFMGTPFESKIYSNEYTVFGKNLLYAYTGNAETFVIPDNITLMAESCFFMSGVKNVVINNNIDVIPNLAFASCSNLKEIIIPDGVAYVGQGAFKDCINLEKVTLGTGVCFLGVDCFANTKIKTIHLGQNVYEITGAFKDCKLMESVTIDPANTALKTDGQSIYKNTTFHFDGKEKKGLILEYYLPSKANGKITLKSNAHAIGAYAFYGCEGIEEVVAKELMYVDSYAFCNSGIKKFSAIGEYRIEDSAFRNCKNLQSINLENADYIGVAAFENCSALKDVTLPEDIEEISEMAFAYTGITEITIFGNDCYIYESAFKGCSNLKTVNLQDGVSYVGMNAFIECPEIETIYISKTVSNFDNNAFSGCEDAHFQVVKGSRGHHFVKKMGYDFETVGSVSFFERITVFFQNLFDSLFGWIL